MKSIRKALLIIATALAVFSFAGTAEAVQARELTPAIVEAVKVGKPKIEQLVTYDKNTNYLVWTQTANAQKYQIYRSTKKSSGFKLIATVEECEYLDTGVKPNTTYYYKLRGITEVNGKTVKSSYSAVKSHKITIGKPVITVDGDEDGKTLTVSWFETALAESYDVYYSTSKTKNFKKLTNTTETSVVFDAGTLNKTYYFKVRAKVTLNGKNYYSSYSAVKGRKLYVDYVKKLNKNDYCGTITNKAKINDEMVALLKAFENNYFHVIKNLEITYKPSVLFCSGYRGYMWDSALNNQVTTRKASPYDLRMTDVEWDLEIKSISYNKKTKIYKIKTLETSRFAFNYLPDNRIIQQKVENEFFVKKVDGIYQLSQQWKEESFYIYLYKKCTSSSGYKKKIDSLNAKYISGLAAKNNEFFESLERANNKELSFSMTAKNKYDRKAAVAYANEYATKRNDFFKKCVSNCMNFASQVMNAGGIPMDYSGSASKQWKSFSKSYSSAQSKTGFSYSWTSISNWLKYLANNDTSPKFVYQRNVEIGLAEPGDVLMVGRDKGKYNHIVVITDIVRDANGRIIDMLYAGNTNDQYHYPISATGYLYSELVKIVGWE